MRELSSVEELRNMVAAARKHGGRIGFVPTMGYLHAGHLRLAEAARQECDLVVMSIYVNPTQFGPSEDFQRYPRDLDHDRRAAGEAGVDILFVPDDATMYPDGPAGQSIWVEPGSLAATLCGASRPGHFRGVATVVTKLFHLVQPDRAYFGQKDGQQAIIVRQLARQLSFPIEVRVIATVREADGLALSSRNVYLSAEERSQAPVVSRALNAARAALERGERNPRRIEGIVRDTITQAPLARLDYAAVVNQHTLKSVSGSLAGDAMIAVAVYFGSTRLIDNAMVFVHGDDVEFI